jgi:ribonucleotide monophosphatase NagD (HAD superfamily)
VCSCVRRTPFPEPTVSSGGRASSESVDRAGDDLDLHAARPGRAAHAQRARRAGGVDLDVGTRDGELPGGAEIATNPDPTSPAPDGPLPATGAVAALISRATGVEPSFVGKPNPLMMRSALNAIGAHSESTAMVDDRMDTDVVSGLEAGMHTVLVLTGSTTRDMVERFPYRPSRIVDSIADRVDELGW